MSEAAAIARSQWRVWGLDASLVVTDARCLDPARRIVDRHLERVGAACSRFRDDSEIRRLDHSDGGPVEVSSTLARLIHTALDGADATDGAVDPTVGAAVIALGYDRDFALIQGRDVPGRATFTAVPRWSDVRLDGQTITLPAGVRLDLGATAKALAADDCAEIVAAELGCGVLVCLGGDIATAGPAPDGGWSVLVDDGGDAPACTIALPAGAAVATSSTRRRRWTQNGSAVHHIIDPTSGHCPADVWQTVSVAAFSCLAANLASTACIVRGFAGARQLEATGLPARLVDSAGAVRLLGGWPSAEGGNQPWTRLCGPSAAARA